MPVHATATILSMERIAHGSPKETIGTPGVIERPDGTKYLEAQRARAFLGLIRAGDTVARALDATLVREHSMSLHQFEVLLFLAVFADERTMPMSELRQRAPLSQSRVSRLVAGLEADGLVVRSADESDTRAVNVALTDAGVAAFVAAQDRHLEDLERNLFSLLTEEEIHQLASITSKILDPQSRED